MSSGAALVAEFENPILAYIEATNSDPNPSAGPRARQRHSGQFCLRSSR